MVKRFFFFTKLYYILLYCIILYRFKKLETGTLLFIKFSSTLFCKCEILFNFKKKKIFIRKKIQHLPHVTLTSLTNISAIPLFKSSSEA